MRFCLFLLSVLAVLLADGTRPSQAQEPASPPGSSTGFAKPAPEPALAIEEVKPDVIHLWDKKKQLVALPGFTLEDFLEFYRRQNDMATGEERPQYSLQQLAITGEANPEHAALTATMEIVLHEADWCRIPLRLDNAILTEKAGYDGPGEHDIRFEEDAGGYVCWMRGEAKSEHKLSLKLLVPVSHTGSQSRVELNTPRATVSQLNLVVPEARVTATASQGATQPTTKEAAGGKSEISVLGVAGQFTLAWRATETQAAGVPTILEASSVIYTRLDGRSANSDATLSVRSFGGEFDRFTVRLPPGAQLIGGQTTGYSIAPGSHSGEVEVKLEKQTSGPVDVRLVTERPHDIEKPDQWLELAGFEVLGAVRQWGHIGVAVAGDWQVVWGNGSRVRQVDELPEVLRRKEVVTGFEFLGQPSSLTARLVARVPRIDVEPEYIYTIEAGQVRLDATWKYRIRAAKVFKLAIDVGDWEIQELGPAAMIDVDSWSREGTLLTVPLMQAAGGEIEISMTGRRPLAPSANVVEFTMPQPRADTVSPATVAVSVADNVRLSPRPKDMAGLVAQPGPIRRKLPPRQQESLIYWADSAEAKFVGDYTVHSQEISARVVSQLAVEQQSIMVEQRLAFRIDFEPADHVTLIAPLPLARADNLEISLDRQRLVPIVTGDPPDDKQARQPNKTVELRVPLPKPRIGMCELLARYSLPAIDLPDNASAVVSVPLLMPGGAKLTQNTVSISAAAGMQVDPQDTIWTKSETSAAEPAVKTLSLSASRATPELQLAVHAGGYSLGGAMVERAWVQTWLTEGLRQDRAAYRITTGQSELRLSLPAGVDLATLELKVDGRVIANVPSGDGPLLVPLDQSGPARQHLLTLEYRCPAGMYRRGRLDLEVPRFEEGVWVRRFYWQLALPSQEHVVALPQGITGEFAWGWDGSFWGRQPLMGQADLERWIGVAPEQGLPGSTNQYLFSTVGQPGQFSIWTASRSSIVFSASFVVLAIGLLLIYVPASRHPGLLLIGAVLMMSAGLLYPDAAVLAAQAAGLGVALTLTATFLQRAFVRRHSRGMVVPTEAPPVTDRSSTQVHLRPPHLSVPPKSSAGTATISMDLPVPEQIS